MSQPLVSIVIPVYNGANFLRDAVDSALAQTYGSVEVIVVNDGSTDGGLTERIAQSYGEAIRYIRKPNGGPASALNCGIDKMRGYLFSWLSHDDIYSPRKIEKQIKVWRENGESELTIIYSGQGLMAEDGVPIGRLKIGPVAPQRFAYHVLLDRFISGCALLIPRAVFNTVGLFAEDLSTVQDYDLWLRMIKAEIRFVFAPGLSGYTRWHPAQDSRRKIREQRREEDELYSGFIQGVSAGDLVATFRNPGFALLKLALKFKRFKLQRSYRICVSSALKALSRDVIFPFSWLFMLYVTRWKRNLDPGVWLRRARRRIWPRAWSSSR